MYSPHTFYIPVMGTGFTIDSPIKVARYGISSVISLVDDTLIEDMRRHYSKVYGEPYTPIHKYDDDWRARRITEYLNLLDRIVRRQTEDLRQSAFEDGSEITKYFEFLPDDSTLKTLYTKMLGTKDPQEKKRLEENLRAQVVPGRIDVNIMTKLDRPNFTKDGQPLSEEFTDALSAFRGYAQSTLSSAIIFSAGFNRRLYSYVENFKDFYADASGQIKKQIVIKVSDFRSAITQGKFFAKKGIWVSEYRVESGLNCGGHAFAGTGDLMGPILEEFLVRKNDLMKELSNVCLEALKLKNKIIPKNFNPFRVTAQGGIGTTKEDRFLRQHFHLDGTGWGSPFLLVPEATEVDKRTLQKLIDAGEKDIYLSDVSPMNVPFNNLRNSQSELKKQDRIAHGHPGSPCLLGHLANNTEFSSDLVCTASRTYQRQKIKQLQDMNLPEAEYNKRFSEITAKACICSDLGDAAYENLNIEKKTGLFTAICPGPNLAYFNRVMTLKEMIDHIYGRINVLNYPNRPHMFVKELQLNVEQFLIDAGKLLANASEKGDVALKGIRDNLLAGISYYQNLIPQILEETADMRQKMLDELTACREKVLRACPLLSAA